MRSGAIIMLGALGCVDLTLPGRLAAVADRDAVALDAPEEEAPAPSPEADARTPDERPVLPDRPALDLAAVAPEAAPVERAPPDAAPADRPSPDRPPDRPPDVSAPAPDTRIAAPLVGHWTFDEGMGAVAADSSGSGNHGMLLAGAAWTGAGRLRAAASFPASNDYVNIADPPDGRLDFGTEAFTVAFWVKTTQIPGGRSPYPMLVTKFEGNTEPTKTGWEIFLWSTNRLGCKLWNLGTTSGVDVTGVNDGRWHHVACRRTRTEIALFLDGRQADTITAAVPTISTAAPVNVGGHRGADNSDFTGDIDDLRIYPAALLPSDIATLAAP